MHFGQIGLEQTRQRSVAGAECLPQRSVAASAGALTSTPGILGRATGAAWETRTVGLATGAGGTETVVGTGTGGGAGAGTLTGDAFPNSCRINSLTGSDISCPQFWHTRRTGFRPISGVTSKAYLAP